MDPHRVELARTDGLLDLVIERTKEAGDFSVTGIAK